MKRSVLIHPCKFGEYDWENIPKNLVKIIYASKL